MCLVWQMGVGSKRYISLCILIIVSAWRYQGKPMGKRGAGLGCVGSAVPNVAVQLKNTATNLTYNSVTNDSGQYNFLNLPVGASELAAQAQGFRRYEVKAVDVQVDQAVLAN